MGKLGVTMTRISGEEKGNEEMRLEAGYQEIQILCTRACAERTGCRPAGENGSDRLHIGTCEN